jgi:hypothetical protein
MLQHIKKLLRHYFGKKYECFIGPENPQLSLLGANDKWARQTHPVTVLKTKQPLRHIRARRKIIK